MKTSGESQLKTYEVTRGEKRGTLNVVCPQRDCRGKFIVSKRWSEGHLSDEGRIFASASCPYCFKTSWRDTP